SSPVESSNAATASSISSSFLPIACLLQQTEQAVDPQADNPLSNVGFALSVHSENGSLDIISLTLTLHLLERFEGVEARPGLEFEPDTRSRKDVTPLTACPCRFSMREGRPNVLGEDLLGSVA